MSFSRFIPLANIQLTYLFYEKYQNKLTLVQKTILATSMFVHIACLYYYKKEFENDLLHLFLFVSKTLAYRAKTWGWSRFIS